MRRSRCPTGTSVFSERAALRAVVVPFISIDFPLAGLDLSSLPCGVLLRSSTIWCFFCEFPRQIFFGNLPFPPPSVGREIAFFLFFCIFTPPPNRWCRLQEASEACLGLRERCAFYQERKRASRFVGGASFEDSFQAEFPQRPTSLIEGQTPKPRRQNGPIHQPKIFQDDLNVKQFPSCTTSFRLGNT